MIDILIMTTKLAVYLFFGLLGFMTANITMTLIQTFQFGYGKTFNCLTCNWMKGKKYFKPLTKEQQEFVDFVTKEKKIEDI